ncbi:MAG: methyltransferase domain-containing protein [Actinomycetota bacterium]|nr:methyltransferase domain-containing protein [Actinomycetota bacterium]
MRIFRRRVSQPRPAPSPSFRRSATTTAGADESDWRTYDNVAEAYARVHAPRTALPARDLVELARVRAGARVLDVGTGTGVVARDAAAHAGDSGVVVGVDASIGMLRRARGDGGGPLYVTATAIDLPFPDEAFSHVLASFVLSHFARYETALFDMVRVLQPGGQLGVAAWGAGEDEFSRAWQELAEQYAGRELLRDARKRAMPWAELFEDPNRLKSALYDAGLRDVQVEHREYRFQETAGEYLEARETGAVGRFLRQMLGERLWATFQARSRQVFTESFPARFSDFRDVNLAVARKP